jgi:hypothetical protein
MQVMERPASFSLQSNDSLRDAFASLDAASADRSQHSLTSILGSLNDESRLSSTGLRAYRRQDDVDARRDRALCGGDSLEQMRKEVQERAERRAEKMRTQITFEQDRRLLSVQSAAPSFVAFPMSIEEVQDGQSTNSLQRDAEEGSTSTVQIPAESSSIESPATTNAPTSSTSEPSEHKRKRTLQWAAKRDKRIARRRHGPPLTRSQAREQEKSDDVVQPSSEQHQQQESSSAPISEDLSADMTDPSYGTVVVVEVEVPQKGKARAAPKRKKTPPLLDMTFTEHDIRLPNGNEAISSQRSSQTESDINSQDMIVRKAAQSKKQNHYDSSDTEEEEEIDDEVVQAWKRRKVAAVGQVKVRAGRKPRAAAKAKPAVSGPSIPKPRISTKKHKGPPLFADLTFIVFGFFAKVKLFGGLVSAKYLVLTNMAANLNGIQIEKHGGIIVKAKDFSEKSNINCIVSCTHSGYKPSSIEVDRWRSQLIKESGASVASVTSLFSDTKMIQEQWISDCIAVSSLVFFNILIPEPAISCDFRDACKRPTYYQQTSIQSA